MGNVESELLWMRTNSLFLIFKLWISVCPFFTLCVCQNSFCFSSFFDLKLLANNFSLVSGCCSGPCTLWAGSPGEQWGRTNRQRMPFLNQHLLPAPSHIHLTLVKWLTNVANADTMLSDSSCDRNWLHRASWEVAFLHFWFATVCVCTQSPEEKGETEEGGDASKSEISLVYEIALKRNLSVNFEVRGKNSEHVTFMFTPPSPIVSC